MTVVGHADEFYALGQAVEVDVRPAGTAPCWEEGTADGGIEHDEAGVMVTEQLCPTILVLVDSSMDRATDTQPARTISHGGIEDFSVRTEVETGIRPLLDEDIRECWMRKQVANIFRDFGIWIIEDQRLGIGLAVEDEDEVCCIVQCVGEKELEVDSGEVGFVVDVGDERTLGGGCEGVGVALDEWVAGWKGCREC